MREFTEKNKFYAKIGSVFFFSAAILSFFLVKEDVLMFYAISEALESTNFPDYIEIYSSSLYLPAMFFATLLFFILTLIPLIRLTVNIKHRIHHIMELLFVYTGYAGIFLYPVYSMAFESYISNRLKSKGYFNCRETVLIYHRSKPVYWVRDKEVCKKYGKKIGLKFPLQFID